MAEELTIAGARVKRRHPWGVWGLTWLTLGIYGIVWWYLINREIRDYSAAKGRPIGNIPELSLLALFPGSIVYIPLLWTYITTPIRVRKVCAIAGGVGRVNVVIAFLAAFALALNLPYMQMALNEVWDAEVESELPIRDVVLIA